MSGMGAAAADATRDPDAPSRGNPPDRGLVVLSGEKKEEKTKWK